MSDKKKDKHDDHDDHDYDPYKLHDDSDDSDDDDRHRGRRKECTKYEKNRRYQHEQLAGNQDYTKKEVDVVVVGTGGGGGMCIEKLTAGGCKVVALEKGPHIPTRYGSYKPPLSQAYAHDELRKRKFNSLVPNSSDYPQTWRPDDSTPTITKRVITCAEMVGGGVVHYATHAWRWHETDYEMLSRYGAITGANVADSPFSYDELEPYYSEAEQIIGVSGDADIVGRNPQEPHHSVPYLNPPLGRKCSDYLLQDAAVAAGQSMYAMPTCARSRPHADGGESCHQCSMCSGYMCDEGAKGNSQTANIPHGLATGRLEVRPNCYVTRVIIDKHGRCKGVEYINTNTGEMHLQKAKIVVLAATAPVTTQILLLSASQHNLFPNGLGNTSGQLGKNYMCHIYGSAKAYVDKDLNNFLGISSNSAWQHYYEPDPLRGHIGTAASMTGGGSNQPIATAGKNYPGTTAPARGWGLDRKQYFRDTYGNDLSASVQCSTLPMETNQIDLDPVVVDKWGIPVPRFTTNTHQNDRLTTRFGAERMMELFSELDGAVSVTGGGVPDSYISKAGVHQVGTARMGLDPSTSVTDKYGRFHDVPNLFVADGSGFATHGASCSSLSIQANGLRVGEYIAVNKDSIQDDD